jgi:hypothetical protein
MRAERACRIRTPITKSARLSSSEEVLFYSRIRRGLMLVTNCFAGSDYSTGELLCPQAIGSLLPANGSKVWFSLSCVLRPEEFRAEKQIRRSLVSWSFDQPLNGEQDCYLVRDRSKPASAKPNLLTERYFAPTLPPLLVSEVGRLLVGANLGAPRGAGELFGESVLRPVAVCIPNESTIPAKSARVTMAPFGV